MAVFLHNKKHKIMESTRNHDTPLQIFQIEYKLTLLLISQLNTGMSFFAISPEHSR